VSALARSHIATRLPAGKLERARAFYAEKLGLEPGEERRGGLLYRCGSGGFALFESDGSSPGTFTQMAFEVDDIDAVVAELRARGVDSCAFALPALAVDGVAEVEGEYSRSRARAGRTPRFRDREGNVLGIGQPIR